MDPMVQQDTPAEQPDPQLELSGTSWGGNKYRYQSTVLPTDVLPYHQLGRERRYFLSSHLGGGINSQLFLAEFGSFG